MCCEFNKIRSLENNRIESDSVDFWKSMEAHLHCVKGESGIHVTEVTWENTKKQRIKVVHTTYRINNNTVIHYGFASPKHCKSPPKFWGENYNFILQNMIGDKLKNIFYSFIEHMGIELPKYNELSEFISNWRKSEIFIMEKTVTNKINVKKDIKTQIANWRNCS